MKNIYEGNSKAWDFIVISLTNIYFGLVRQCKKMHMELNKGGTTARSRALVRIQIFFNELYNLNLRFKRIKAKYEKD